MSKQVGKVITATKIYFDATYFNSQNVGGVTLPADPNADKFLMWDDSESELVWADAGGSFSGDMDDIDDGTTYVKTENNYTDEEKTKLDGLTGGLTQGQIKRFIR